MSTPCDISGAIQILTTTVEQVDFIVVQIYSCVFFRLVVDNSAICSNRRNAFKRQALEEIILLSEFLHFLSTCVFIKPMIRLLKSFLKVSKVFHNSHTVSNIGLSHSFLLNLIFASLQ